MVRAGIWTSPFVCKLIVTWVVVVTLAFIIGIACTSTAPPDSGGKTALGIVLNVVLLGPPIAAAAISRCLLRRKYNIPGCFAHDCFVSTCCHCCANWQEARHVDAWEGGVAPPAGREQL